MKFIKIMALVLGVVALILLTCVSTGLIECNIEDIEEQKRKRSSDKKKKDEDDGIIYI